MRIVHVCRVAPPSIGGMEAVIGGLSTAQQAAGHEVTVLTTWRPADGARSWQTDGGVTVRHLRRLGARRYPLAAGLREGLARAEVIHVHGVDGLADQVLSVRPPRAAVGISTHGGFLHTRRQWALKQVWLRTVTRWSLGRADAVWFTSHADVQALAPAGLKGGVVPNGIVVPDVQRRPEVGRWLCLGRVTPHKGLEDALRLLAAAGPPAHLHVVGPCPDPAYARRLQALAATLGVADRLHLHGAATPAEKAEHLARAELALFLSRHEGFGLAALEASAAGLPVVVTPIAAFRELGLAPACGVEVDGGDPAGGAARLAAWTPADRRRAGEAGRRLGLRYAWPAVLPMWEAAYAAAREARCASV